jgi:NAD-dependent deacetylase
MPIELALSGEMMRRQPQITWKYIHQIESACRQARYNAAHAALAQMQDHHQQFTVLTQNIDGFHTDAGSRDVIEIHGNLHQLYCTVCGAGRHVSSYAGLEIPPACADCGGLLRPQVVLFGEMLPEPAMDRLHRLLEDGVDLVMTVGTTSVFPYIAAPVLRAMHSGVPTVEINPGMTEVSDQVRHRLVARAADALPALMELVKGRY